MHCRFTNFIEFTSDITTVALSLTPVVGMTRESWGGHRAWWHLQRGGPHFERLCSFTPASGLQSPHGGQVRLVPTSSQMTCLLIPDDQFGLECDSFSKFLGDR